MSAGRIVKCEGHARHNELGGTVAFAPCQRVARLVGFPADATWFCGHDEPFVQRVGRTGQQKQKGSK